MTSTNARGALTFPMRRTLIFKKFSERPSRDSPKGIVGKRQIEITRILHDGMDFQRHLPSDETEEI